MNVDIDCCAVGYDGEAVWAIPRAIRGQKKNKINTIFFLTVLTVLTPRFVILISTQKFQLSNIK